MSCDFCYAKSLLDFRHLWDAEKPRAGDVETLRKQVARIRDGETVRLGGMTDCFMYQEAELGITYELLKMLNEARRPYLIVTKSELIATPKYLGVLDPELAHVQISVCTTDDEYERTFEKAPDVSHRLRAYHALEDAGIDVALRLSPILPDHVDFDAISGHKCLVEFMRVNHWIEKWMPMDFSRYTLKSGGYRHLQLEDKVDVIGRIRNFDQISVCEDVDEHYAYWREHVNANPDDCCNLSLPCGAKSPLVKAL